mgnify:FL=1
MSFSGQKKRTQEEIHPPSPPRNTPESKTQPIVVPVKRYVETPRYKFSMFPEINIPEILQVFGGGKTEPVSPPDQKIPFIKKPVNQN